MVIQFPKLGAKALGPVGSLPSMGQLRVRQKAGDAIASNPGANEIALGASHNGSAEAARQALFENAIYSGNLSALLGDRNAPRLPAEALRALRQNPNSPKNEEMPPLPKLRLVVNNK